MKKTTLLRTAMLLMTAGFVFIGCTKKTPYEPLLEKEKNHSSDQFRKSEKEGVEYLYTASTANSSRSSDVARPYWQGEEKIIKFKFTENSLDVLEVESEERFQQNSTNNKLIMSIPVEHLEYSCAADSSGECTNKEEINKKIHWSKRSQFKPDFENMKVTEVSMLPVELENLFNQGCYQSSANKLVGYEIKDDKINILMEKTFTANINCVNALDKLSDLTFSQVYHYSFAKLSKLTSPDFKPVAYPTTDENTFGFFTTKFTNLNIDNNSSEKDKVVLMNHWNPNRKVINYFLSPEFAKRENAQIKNATELSVQRINDSLKIAGVDLKIELTQAEENQQLAGDITGSMIVLVEDPSASGVLGYGPSITNPRTGEILSARVVMYKGILERYIKDSYEEIRRGELAKLNDAKSNKMVALKIPAHLMQIAQPEADAKTKASAIKSSEKAMLTKVPNNIGLTKDLKAIEKSLKNYTQNVKVIKKDALSIYESGKHCYYTTEAISVDGKVSADVVEVMGNDLTAWEDLSTSQKKQVLDILMPVAWIPTLVHELGHNLGLRHNFSGSEDKDNYFKAEQLSQIGVNHDIPYSSVMDYGASELNLLPTMGSYDIAALRYGYNRQVEKAGGDLITLDSSIENFKTSSATATIKLKDYKYCTDENVGANAGCKRFDAGSTYTEIAKHLVNDYESKYYLRNLRNHRLNFSLVGDITYAQRMEYIFDNLRTFFEVRERIVNQFGLAEDAPEWESIAWLKDLNDAVKISGDFFIKVLTTPDLTCAVAPAATPDQVQFLVPVDGLTKGAASCYETDINPAYVVVGQFGKSFQSRKSTLSTNAYIDQIDVRGIWVDKVLAAKYVFNRKTGSFTFDKYTDNYTDMPEFKQKLTDLSQMMLLNKATAEVTIRDQKGMALVSGLVNVDTFKTHVIPELISPYVAKAMGVPANDSYFMQTYLQTLASQMASTPASQFKGREMVDQFSIRHTSDLSDNSNIKSALQIDIGNTKYLAHSEKNLMAAVLIENAQTAKALLGLQVDELSTIAKAREKGETAPETGLSVAQTAAWTIDISLLKQFINLGLTFEETQELIQIMPAS